MELTISPGALGGTVAVPPSKSEAHRALIAAAVADRETLVTPTGDSADIAATVRCLTALGASAVLEGRGLRVTPIRGKSEAVLDCGESGSTLRFLLPVTAALGRKARFTGGGRLPKRPLGELCEALEAHGIRFTGSKLPFCIEGQLKSGDYLLGGDISSQYISGLLMALPMLPGDSRITLTGDAVSAGYIALTRQVLCRFGIKTEETRSEWRIPGGQKAQSPGTFTVGGDWSNAAFWLAAGAWGCGITVTELEENSAQPDRAMIPMLRQMGGRLETGENAVTVKPSRLYGSEFDLNNNPDLLLPLAVAAAMAEGESRFTGIARLRHTESDRPAALCRLLASLGGSAAAEGDTLSVQGGGLIGGVADACGDHRIAMAAAIAAAGCRESVTIRGAECVAKSYPAFWEDYGKLQKKNPTG